MDESTASALQSCSEEQEYLTRRLARVRPSGIESAINIYELSDVGSSHCQLDSEKIRCYESGLDAFLGGDWKLADEMLSSLDEFDTPSKMLRAYLKKHQNRPPDHWDGVIDLPKY